MARTPLFPESYAPWLAKRLPGSVEETLATCVKCAMVNPKSLPLTRDPGPFKAELKCCTYFPFVPNFSLGAILKENGEAARVRLKAAASQGILFPYGLFAAPEREALAKKAGSKGFGRHKELLCPFFDSASHGCSVWRHRPGVCATYFCASDRGAEGLELWSDLETYLNHFEWTLANEVLWRVGFTNDDTEMCEAVMLEEPGPERDAMARATWAEWAGREEELLKLCAERAREVTSEEIAELMGEDFLELEASLRERSR